MYFKNKTRKRIVKMYKYLQVACTDEFRSKINWVRSYLREQYCFLKKFGELIV